jgi:hypothetical protein
VSTDLYLLDESLRPFAEYLVRAASDAGLAPRITSTRRSSAEQERLYRRFLAGQAPFPAAPPGASAHEYGWAFDMVVEPFEALEDVGRFWQSELGGEWGRQSDPVHFQLPGATQAAKNALKQAILDNQALSSTPWLFRRGVVPHWLEGAFKLVPGVSTVSYLLDQLGLR